MTLQETLNELESYGDANTKKTLLKHGAKEPFFGVKVQDLKKVLKKTKKDHALSLALYDTGNSDAMYLAGLMTDEQQVTKAQLQKWVTNAYWYFLCEYTVPWVAAETPFGIELGMEWIESDNEQIASAGWATFANCAAVKEDEELDLKLYSQLIERVEQEVHQAKNRVGYAMNAFIIATGAGIKDLTSKSMEVAKRIGKVEVEMGGTACKVPLATDYIQKIIDKDRIGKKRKTARC
jgi:3-methyladenine DNA glycosylase AlkD